LSCLPISQPDSHPGSQLVSAQFWVRGAQLAGRHQMK